MTNADETRHQAEKLTPQQARAVDELASGATVTQASECVGVTRQTVSGWLNRDCKFQAELNRRRHELWVANVDRLRAMLPKALDVLERALGSKKDALRAACLILKAAGPPNVHPRGSTEAEDLELEVKRSERIREILEYDLRPKPKLGTYSD